MTPSEQYNEICHEHFTRIERQLADIAASLQDTPLSPGLLSRVRRLEQDWSALRWWTRAVGVAVIAQMVALAAAVLRGLVG